MSSTNGSIIYQADDGEEVTSVRKQASSTNGSIIYQADDGEEVTSVRKQPSEFDEIKKEMEDDTTFARENNMNSIYWCWNCQYSDCDRH